MKIYLKKLPKLRKKYMSKNCIKLTKKIVNHAQGGLYFHEIKFHVSPCI